MECKNCGNPLLEGDRFCSKCGTRVTEAAKAEDPAAEAAKAETPAAEAEKAIPLCIPEEKPSRHQCPWKNFSPDKKKAMESGRHKKQMPRVILGILGVIALVLAANSAKLVNSYHRNFSTPEEYYRWVERRAIRQNAKTFSEYYANCIMEYLQRYDSCVSGEICLELGNAGRDMMESAGLEPWFEEGSLTYEMTRRSGVEQNILGLEIGGEKLFRLDAVMDLQDEAAYLGFPGLAEKYLALDTVEKDFVREFESLFHMEPEEYLKTMELWEAFYKECPDKKQMETLADRYLELLLDNIDDVKMRTGKTARADNVTQACTTLKIYLDKDDLRNMLSDFLKELREDSEIENLLYQNFELKEELDLDDGRYRDAEEFYEAFQDEIDEILEDMDYYVTYHNELDMTVYVDNRGRIIGRSMEFPNSWDEISVSWLFPRSGSRFGYKASITADDGELSVSGSGKGVGSKIDGSFTLKYNGYGIVDVEVEDLELKSLKKGFLNGSFAVTVSPGIRRIGDMDRVYSDLSDLQMILKVSTDSSSQKLRMELREGRELCGVLTMSARSSGGKKISVPSTRRAVFVEDGSDFMDWWDTIEWEKLIKSMEKAGLPSDTIERVEELSEMDEDELMDELAELLENYFFRNTHSR